MITPKYKFFHKRDYGIATGDDADRYLKFISNRINISPSDVVIVADHIYKLPINQIRALSAKYRFSYRIPVDATHAFRQMIKYVFVSVLCVTEEKRMETVVEHMDIYQRVRVVRRWIKKNMGKDYDDSQWTLKMAKLMLIIYSLGLTPDYIMDVMVEIIGIGDVDKPTENFLETINDAQNYGDNVFGPRVSLIDGIIFSMDNLFYKTKQKGRYRRA